MSVGFCSWTRCLGCSVEHMPEDEQGHGADDDRRHAACTRAKLEYHRDRLGLMNPPRRPFRQLDLFLLLSFLHARF